MSDWSRRRFLTGLGGVTLALPVFTSLLPRSAWAQAATRKRFLMVVRAGNGIVQQGSEVGERFWPRALGALTVADLKTVNADRATSVLGDYAQRLLMVKNVRLPFARNACGHAEALPQVLTAQNHTGGTSNSPLARGRSVDWHVSDVLNGVGRAPPATQVLVASRRKSVNDLVRGELRELSGKAQLSLRDKQRLQQHLAAVRDMELQMTCDLDPTQVSAVQAITSPEGNDVRPQAVRSFMDLAAWAFNCQLNHVATLQVGPGNDGTQYTINGAKLPSFHWISHRISADGSEGQAIPDAVELHASIDRLQLTFFKHLLDRLNSYGSANGGTLRTGQVIDHQRNPVNQVLNTLINGVGIRKASGAPTDDFGDVTLARGVVANSLV